MNIKYLIIRLSSIGDIVLTTPVIRCLKKQVENCEIHFVTKQKHALIVKSNPYIQQVHILNENISELISELKNERFDYVIDLHQNFRSNRIKSGLNVTSFTFEKLNIQKFLLVNFKLNRLPAGHIVDRYMKTISVFDVVNDGEGLDFFIPENENYNKELLPGSFRNQYIAFVIGGTYFTKKLPVEKIKEICKRLNIPVILLGGKNELRVGEEVAESSGGTILNMAGKINLNESASLIRSAACRFNQRHRFDAHCGCL